MEEISALALSRGLQSPHLLAALAESGGSIPESEYQQAVKDGERLGTRSAEFVAQLVAGIKENWSRAGVGAPEVAGPHNGQQKVNTVLRLLEQVASKLAPLPAEVAELERYKKLVADAHAPSSVQQHGGTAPYVLPKTSAASSSSTEARTEQVLLQTLSVLLDTTVGLLDHSDIVSAGSSLGMGIEGAVQAVEQIASSVRPGTLFSEWSPQPLPAERPLPLQFLDPWRTAASATEHGSAATPDKWASHKPVVAARALLSAIKQQQQAAGFQAAEECPVALPDGQFASLLATASHVKNSWAAPAAVSSGTAEYIWAMAFPQPVPISSIRIFWAGGAPRSFTVETTSDALPEVAASSSSITAPGSQQEAARAAFAALLTKPRTDVTGVQPTFATTVLSQPGRSVAGGAGADAAAPTVTESADGDSGPAVAGVEFKVTWRARYSADVAEEEIGGNAAPHSAAAMAAGVPASAMCSTAVLGVMPNGDALRVTGLRIICKGKHAHATEALCGIALVVPHIPAAELVGASASGFVQRLQGFLHAVAAAPAPPPAAEALPPAEAGWPAEGNANRSDVDADDGTWACEVCTVLNNPENTVCELCAAPRPSSGAGAGSVMARSSADVGDAALTASLRMALATASQSALLHYAGALLQADRPDRAADVWDKTVGPGHAAAAGEAMDLLAAERVPAIGRSLALCGAHSASGNDGQLCFDPSAGSPSGLTFSDDRLDVSSRTGSNTLAVTNRGCSSGVIKVTFRLVEDSNSSECTCFGFVRKPVTEYSYSNSNAWMYRGFNGQIYGSGSTGSTRKNIHPRDLVTMEYNADLGTISYTVNSDAQGVCFNVPPGTELFPAVNFYSADRRVAIVSFTSSGAAAHDSREAALKAAQVALEAGEGMAGALEAAALVYSGADPAASGVAAPLAASLAAAAAAKVASRPPEPPRLADADSYDFQISKYPGIAMLVDMGFHWSMAAQAVRDTNGNVETAADRLLSGSVSDSIVAATEARIAAHNAAMRDHAKKLAEYEAKQKEDDEKLQAAKAEAEAARAAAVAQRQAALTASARPLVEELVAVQIYQSKPTTRAAIAASLLAHMCDLAAAYTPNLLRAAGSEAVHPSAGTLMAPEYLSPTPVSSSAEHFAVSGGGGAAAPSQQAALAVAVNSAAPSATSVLSLAPVSSQLQAISLEEPYAIQASGSTFAALRSLLHVCMVAWGTAVAAKEAAQSAGQEEQVRAARIKQIQAREMAVCVLRLVRANLHRLQVAHVDPITPGLLDSIQGPGSSRTTSPLAALHADLDEILSDAGVKYDVGLQLETVRVIDSGLQILYSSADQRAALLHRLLAKQEITQQGASGGRPSPARTALLLSCLAHFSSPIGVLTLLPPLSPLVQDKAQQQQGAQGAGSDAEIGGLLSALFDVLTADSNRLLSGAAESHTRADDALARTTLLRNSAALLALYQRHLLSRVQRECEAAESSPLYRRDDGTFAAQDTEMEAISLSRTDPEALLVRLAGRSWLSHSSASNAPASRVLLLYLSHLGGHAVTLLNKAAAAAEAQLEHLRTQGKVGLLPRELNTDLRAVLDGSVVSLLLPPFVAGISPLLAAQPWLAAAALPALHLIISSLDRLTTALVASRVLMQAETEVAMAHACASNDTALQTHVQGGHSAQHKALALLFDMQALHTSQGTLLPPSPAIIGSLRKVHSGRDVVSDQLPELIAMQGVEVLDRAPTLFRTSLPLLGATADAWLWLLQSSAPSSKSHAGRFDLGGIGGAGVVMLDVATLYRLQCGGHAGLPGLAGHEAESKADTDAVDAHMDERVLPLLAHFPPVVCTLTVSGSSVVAASSSGLEAPSASSGDSSPRLVRMRLLLQGPDMRSLARTLASGSASAASHPLERWWQSDTVACLYAAGHEWPIAGRDSGARDVALLASRKIKLLRIGLDSDEVTRSALADYRRVAEASSDKTKAAEGSADDSKSAGDRTLSTTPLLSLQAVQEPPPNLPNEVRVQLLRQRWATLKQEGTARPVNQRFAQWGNGLRQLAAASQQQQMRANLWTLKLQRLVGSVFGSGVGCLVAGPRVSLEEDELKPLLVSHLLQSGIQTSGTPSAPAMDLTDLSGLSLDWQRAVAAASAAFTPTTTTAADPSATPQPAGPSEVDLFINGVMTETPLAEGGLSTQSQPGKSPGAALLEWLRGLTPEKPALRRAGVFPAVELPLLLALAKHTGQVSASLIPALKQLQQEGAPSPVASDDLLALWKEVRYIRSYLREEKKEFTSRISRREEKQAAASKDAARAGDQSTSAGTPGGPAIARSGPPRALQPEEALTFDQLLAGMRSRALFMLQVAPALDSDSTANGHLHTQPTLIRGASLEGSRLVRVPSMTRSYNAAGIPTAPSIDGLGPLHTRWAAMLPPSQLQPLAARYSFGTTAMESAASSMPSSGPLLARQKSWDVLEKATGSDAGTPSKDVSSELQDMAEEAAEDTAVAVSGASSSPFDALAKAVKSYVKFGVGAPPVLLSAILGVRTMRATARGFAFRALAATAASCTDYISMTEALVPFRSALRGLHEKAGDSKFVASADGARASASSDRKSTRTDGSVRWQVHHHHLVNLEGCANSSMAAVVQARASLFGALGELFATAVDRRDFQAASLVLWCWSTDVQHGDFSLLLKTGFLPGLAGLTSLPSTATAHADDVPVSMSRESPLWMPWRVSDVRSRLEDGSISKLEVLAHLAIAPENVQEHVTSGRSFLVSRGVGLSDVSALNTAADAASAASLDSSDSPGSGTRRAADVLSESQLQTLGSAAMRLNVDDVVELYAAYSAELLRKSSSTPSGLLEAGTSPTAHDEDVFLPIQHAAEADALAAADAHLRAAAIDGWVPLPRDSGNSWLSFAGDAVGDWPAADAASRTNRGFRNRSSTVYLPHGPCQLVADFSRTPSGSCSSCTRPLDKGGRFSWVCHSHSYRICEECFAARAGSELWERPSFGYSATPGALTCKPGKGPLFSGLQLSSPPVTIQSLRDLLWRPASASGFDPASWIRYMMLAPATDVLSPVPVEQLVATVRLHVPTRVLVFVPEAFNKQIDEGAVPWLSRAFVRHPEASYTLAVAASTIRLVAYRSRYVYVPPTVYSGALADSAVLELYGLGNLRPSGSNTPLPMYTLVAFEELLPSEVTSTNVYVPHSARSSGKAALAQLLRQPAPPPLRPISLLCNLSSAVLRTLMTLVLVHASEDSNGGANGTGRALSAGTQASGAKAKALPPSSDPSTAALLRVVFSILHGHLSACANVLRTAGGLHQSRSRGSSRRSSSSGLPAQHEQGSNTHKPTLLHAQGQPRSSAAATHGRQIEVVEAESLATSALSFLLAVADTPAAKEQLPGEPFMICLLSLAAHGSPRLFRLVMRIVRAIATRLEPLALDHALRAVFPLPVIREWEALGESTASNPPEEELGDTPDLFAARCSAVVGWLFHVIASPSLPACGIGHVLPTEVAAAQAQPARGASRDRQGDSLYTGAPMHADVSTLAAAGLPLFGTGVAAQAAASEAVALARTLTRLSGWRSLLTVPMLEAVKDAALAVAAAVSSADADQRDVVLDQQVAIRYLASTSILGSFLEPIRVGARVRCTGFLLAGPRALSSLSTVQPSKTRDIGIVAGMEGVLVQVVHGSSNCRVVFSEDLSSSPTSIDTRRIVPVAQVPAYADILQLSTELASAFASILSMTGGPKAQATHPLRSQLHACALGALANLLRQSSAVSAALSSGLLPALYDSALRSADEQAFTAVPALAAMVRCLDGRLYERRETLTGGVSDQGNLAMRIPDVSRSALGDDATAATERLPVLLQLKSVVDESGVPPSLALGALAVNNYDAVAASKWIQAHRTSYKKMKVAVQDQVAFVAHVPLGTNALVRLHATLPATATGLLSTDIKAKVFYTQLTAAHSRMLANILSQFGDAAAEADDAAWARRVALRTEALESLWMYCTDEAGVDESILPQVSAPAAEWMTRPVSVVRCNDAPVQVEADARVHPVMWCATVDLSAALPIISALSAKAQISSMSSGGIAAVQAAMPLAWPVSSPVASASSNAFAEAGHAVAMAPAEVDGPGVAHQANAEPLQAQQRSVVFSLVARTVKMQRRQQLSDRAPLLGADGTDVATAAVTKAKKSSSSLSYSFGSSSGAAVDEDALLVADSELLPAPRSDGSTSAREKRKEVQDKAPGDAHATGSAAANRAGALLAEPFVLSSAAPTVDRTVVPVVSAVEEAREFSRIAGQGVTSATFRLRKRAGGYAIAVGLAHREYVNDKYCGTNSDSWSWLNDGRKGSAGQWDQHNVRPGYGEGDTITVIHDKQEKTVRFLRNGNPTGAVFTDVKPSRPLFPSVTLANTGDEVELVATEPPGFRFALGSSFSSKMTIVKDSNGLVVRSSVTTQEGVTSTAVRAQPPVATAVHPDVAEYAEHLARHGRPSLTVLEMLARNCSAADIARLIASVESFAEKAEEARRRSNLKAAGYPAEEDGPGRGMRGRWVRDQGRDWRYVFTADDAVSGVDDGDAEYDRYTNNLSWLDSRPVLRAEGQVVPTGAGAGAGGGSTVGSPAASAPITLLSTVPSSRLQEHRAAFSFRGKASPHGIVLRAPASAPSKLAAESLLSAPGVRPMPAGIMVLAAASAVFHLGQGFSRFDSYVALTDEVHTSLALALAARRGVKPSRSVTAAPPAAQHELLPGDFDVTSVMEAHREALTCLHDGDGVVFEVVGDGVCLWRSLPLIEARQRDVCVCNVFGVDKLELRAMVVQQTDSAADAGDSRSAVLPMEAVPCAFLDPALRGYGLGDLVSGVLVAVASGAQRSDHSLYTADMLSLPIGVLLTSESGLNAPAATLDSTTAFGSPSGSTLASTRPGHGAGGFSAHPRNQGSQSTSGSTGITGDTSVALQKVRFFDVESGRVSDRWVRAADCFRLTSMYGVRMAPAAKLGNQGSVATLALLNAATRFRSSLAVHTARLCVQTLLSSFAEQTQERMRVATSSRTAGRVASGNSLPPFTVATVGGAHRLLQLVRVVAACDPDAGIGGAPVDGSGAALAGKAHGADEMPASQSEITRVATETDALTDGLGMARISAMRFVLSQLLAAEGRERSALLPSSASALMVEPVADQLSPASANGEKVVQDFDGDNGLSKWIVADCIRSFTGSISPSSASVTVLESPHPLPAQGVYTGHVEIPGAGNLVLHFSPQCASKSDSVLTLFNHPSLENKYKIMSFSGLQASSGSAGRWPSDLVVVPGDRFWWRLTCGAGVPVDELLELKARWPKRQVPTSATSRVDAGSGGAEETKVPEASSPVSPGMTSLLQVPILSAQESAAGPNACPACTFVNSDGALVCEICDSTLPARAAASHIPSNVEDASDEGEEADFVELQRGIASSTSSESGDGSGHTSEAEEEKEAEDQVPQQAAQPTPSAFQRSSSSEGLNLGWLYREHAEDEWEDDSSATAGAGGAGSNKLITPSGVAVSREAVLQAGTASSEYGFHITVCPSTGQWTRELHALQLTPPEMTLCGGPAASLAVASLPWACWTLDFLLNQVVLRDMDSTGERMGVLSRGAVHNQQMVDALSTFLRTTHVTPVTRARVMALLSQLIASPQMFAVPPELGSLSGVQSAAFTALNDVLPSDSSKRAVAAVPPQLQAMTELALALQAASTALAAVDKAHQALAARNAALLVTAACAAHTFDFSSGEEPASDGADAGGDQLRRRALRQAAGLLPPPTTSSAAAVSPAASNVTTAGASGEVASAAAAAASDDSTTVALDPYSLGADSFTLRPVVPRTDGSALLISGLQAQLQAVYAVSAALLHGLRPSDDILCAAWLDAVGTHRYIETPHPYQPGTLHFDVAFDGGVRDLSIVFHPRCATLPGASLSISSAADAALDATKPFGGPAADFTGADDDDDAEGASARAKKGNWPHDPVTVSGTSCHLTFRASAASAGGASSGAWGVALTVTASGMQPSSRAALISKSIAAVHADCARVLTGWDPAMDEELCELVRVVAELHNSRRSKKDGGSARYTHANLPYELLAIPSATHEMHFRRIVNIPLPILRLRYALLRLLNEQLSTTLPCFDLSSTYTWSVGHRLRSLSGAIFPAVKQAILTAVLDATKGRRSADLTLMLSNFKATESETRGDVTPERSRCMFVQAYEQLSSQPSSAFRSLRDTGQNKVFEVKFDGESGIDAGGVYREGMQRICDDLFSERFNLLIKCPNARTGYKTNTSSYVPNPALRTPLAMSMFEFLGRMLGLSLRTKAALPFAFPSIVWKAMVGEKVRWEDLALQDGMYAQYLAAIRHCDKDMSVENEPQTPITTEEAFAAAFPHAKWVVTNCAGEEVELAPNGSQLPVSFSARHSFADAAEAYRLHEFDVQLAAIRRGFANVVPLRALALFTWRECEELVAGRPDIDVALLRRHTRYEAPYDSKHPVIRRFWRVFASFTPEERAMYVRFAWGRSRLPSDSSGWTSQHTVTRLSGVGLPFSHTCFFTIDLPEYATDDAMRTALLTALHYGIGGILNG